MRSDRGQVGPNPHDWCPYKKRGTWAQRHGWGGDVCARQGALGRPGPTSSSEERRAQVSSRAPKRRQSDDNLMSDVQPPELRTLVSPVSNRPVWGDLFLRRRERMGTAPPHLRRHMPRTTDAPRGTGAGCARLGTAEEPLRGRLGSPRNVSKCYTRHVPARGTDGRGRVSGDWKVEQEFAWQGSTQTYTKGKLCTSFPV